MKQKDRSYDGWNEYDIKEKCWQIYTLGGQTYIKLDFKGNFININSQEIVPIRKIFHLIRNCTDSEGYILAKRKKYGAPLCPLRNKKKRIPIYKY